MEQTERVNEFKKQSSNETLAYLAWVIALVAMVGSFFFIEADLKALINEELQK